MGSKALREERDRLILAAMPGTLEQIAAKTGVPRNTVWRLVGIMHSNDLVHISAWPRRHHGGKPAPEYSAGPGEDAPFESTSKRAQAAASSEPLLDPRRRNRELAIADRTAKTRDPMIEALFGPAKRAA